MEHAFLYTLSAWTLAVNALTGRTRTLNCVEKSRGSKAKSKTIIGWVEVVVLPTLSTRKVDAKVDTGAETCSLHATDITVNGRYVSFKALGKQHRLKLIDIRSVKSSNGYDNLRPVVALTVHFAGKRERVEFTLTNRGSMKYPVLLGRNYLADDFLVDAGFTHLLGRKSRR